MLKKNHYRKELVESRNPFRDQLKSDYLLLQSSDFFCQVLSTVNCQLSTVNCQLNDLGTRREETGFFTLAPGCNRSFREKTRFRGTRAYILRYL